MYTAWSKSMDLWHFVQQRQLVDVLKAPILACIMSDFRSWLNLMWYRSSLWGRDLLITVTVLVCVLLAAFCLAMLLTMAGT